MYKDDSAKARSYPFYIVCLKPNIERVMYSDSYDILRG